ncbi:MAG: hypothetical protein AAB671_00095 [Patescibacteria group bacterium]
MLGWHLGKRFKSLPLAERTRLAHTEKRQANKRTLSRRNLTQTLTHSAEGPVTGTGAADQLARSAAPVALEEHAPTLSVALGAGNGLLTDAFAFARATILVGLLMLAWPLFWTTSVLPVVLPPPVRVRQDLVRLIDEPYDGVIHVAMDI